MFKLKRNILKLVPPSLRSKASALLDPILGNFFNEPNQTVGPARFNRNIVVNHKTPEGPNTDATPDANEEGFSLKVLRFFHSILAQFVLKKQQNRDVSEKNSAITKELQNESVEIKSFYQEKKQAQDAAVEKGENETCQSVQKSAEIDAVENEVENQEEQYRM